MVIAESTYCKQEFMGRKSEVSSEPSLSDNKGYKLMNQTHPLVLETSNRGRDYQDSVTVIAHHSQPRWKDTP